jgi:hypothetical protein
MKHTPGPWKTVGAGVDASMVSSTLKNGRRVSFRVACCKDGDIETIMANARLIAAAPQLLDFAKNVAGLDDRLLTDISILKQWRDDARALFAKAGGQL